MTHSPALRLSAFLTLCLLVWSSEGNAQTAPSASTANDPAYVAQACIDQMTERLGQEQRIYRGVLLGIHDAKDETVGTTRYTVESTQTVPWIKMGPDAWKSDAPGFQGTTRRDAQINQRTERDVFTSTPFNNDPTLAPWPNKQGKFERRGLLTATQASTSDIIPSLLQSYRALHCRLAAVCQSVALGFEGTAETELPIDSPGCRTLLMPPLDRCDFKAVDREANPFVDRGSEAFVRTFCHPVVDQIADREAEVLQLVVAYDASYRSLLQFAGNMDYFLRLFNGNGLAPLRQAIPLLGKLQQIPCFLSECNE